MFLITLITALVYTTVAGAGPGSGLPFPEPRRSPDIAPAAGTSCSTSGTRGFPPTKCDFGGTCVLTDFGFPAVDIPNEGICRRVSTRTPKCSVDYCSRKGAFGVCRVSDQYAFCSAWATRRDGGPTPDCPDFCTEECLVEQLRASDGSTYCNACKLISASCRAEFSVFGPVSAPDTCFREFLGFEGRECCEKYRVGCILPAESCSTGGSLLPPIPCLRSTTCVVTDFGFPPVDLPSSGHCRWVYRVRKCSLDRCDRFGNDSLCKVDGVVATCGAWLNRK